MRDGQPNVAFIGGEPIEGQTAIPNCWEERFTVVIQSGSRLGINSVKDLLETKYKVIDCVLDDSTVYLEAVDRVEKD